MNSWSVPAIMPISAAWWPLPTIEKTSYIAPGSPSGPQVVVALGVICPAAVMLIRSPFVRTMPVSVQETVAGTLKFRGAPSGALRLAGAVTLALVEAEPDPDPDPDEAGAVLEPDLPAPDEVLVPDEVRPASGVLLLERVASQTTIPATSRTTIEAAMMMVRLLPPLPRGDEAAECWTGGGWTGGGWTGGWTPAAAGTGCDATTGWVGRTVAASCGAPTIGWVGRIVAASTGGCTTACVGRTVA
jgi:hypothetical protein